jgi:RHS repeat-associated protein
VGNVKTIADGKAGPQTQSFNYDELDRLINAQATGGSYGAYSLEQYGYTNTGGKIGNLTSKGTSNYTDGTQSSSCSDGALGKAHAVVTAGSNTYCYDRNGNMVRRTVGSAYNLSYDAENRLTGISGAASASFYYDADGNRVKATVNGATTAYVGNYFEWVGSTSTMVKYYYADGQRVAMRQKNASTNVLSFLLSDHLGSTAVTANSGGAKVAELRYKAWGETRPSGYAESATPTTYRFTSQRLESGVDSVAGLYYYNARWYDPYLNRWLSPDTIVPQPGNPQSLNRYSYVLNNPVKYTDPTGHWEKCGEGPGCDRPLTDQERFDLERQRRRANGLPVPQPGFALPIAEEDAVRIPQGGRYGDQRDAGKHPGGDISAYAGTPVYDFTDGIVVAVDTMRGNGFGNYIVIHHVSDDGNIYYSVYGHLQRQDVRSGDVALVGDQIALSGQSGGVPAHLHFEIRDAGGFNEANGQFLGSYFPGNFEALDASYTSPAEYLSAMNTVYGRSIENTDYQSWRYRMDRVK